MEHKILLPVRDPDEIVSAKTVSELSGLLDDPEAADICRELLLMAEMAASPGTASVGVVGQMIDIMEPAERRMLLDACRVRSGRKTVRAEREAERLAYHRRNPDFRDHPPVYSPSGAIVSATDIEDETARVQAWEASMKRRRAAESEQRAVEARAIAQSEAERDAAAMAEMPEVFRRPAS